MLVRTHIDGHAQLVRQESQSRRLLKEAVQQGRSERRPEAYPLGLR